MWPTVYTDGKIFSTVGFLPFYDANGGYLNNDQFRQALSDANRAVRERDRCDPSSITVHQSRILSVNEQNGPGHETYEFEAAYGVAALTLPKSLRSVVHAALGVRESDGLVGVVVQTVFDGNKILGFRKLPNGA